MTLFAFHCKCVQVTLDLIWLNSKMATSAQYFWLNSFMPHSSLPENHNRYRESDFSPTENPLLGSLLLYQAVCHILCSGSKGVQMDTTQHSDSTNVTHQLHASLQFAREPQQIQGIRFLTHREPSFWFLAALLSCLSHFVFWIKRSPNGHHPTLTQQL